MWTINMPVVSTEHISEQTRDLLTSLHGNTAQQKPICWVAKYSEGFFVRFWDDQEPETVANLPDDLRLIRSWLISAGYLDLWVRIDADGDEVEGLNIYEW